MTRIILSLAFLTIPFPAFGQDEATVKSGAVTNHLPVESGGEIFTDEDGNSRTFSPDHVTANIENERAMAKAQAKAARDETSNGSLFGRASMSGEICGLEFKNEAVGRRGPELAAFYKECAEGDALVINALGRANNARLALLLGEDFNAEDDETNTGKAAIYGAASDDEGGGLGFGLGGDLYSRYANVARDTEDTRAAFDASAGGGEFVLETNKSPPVTRPRPTPTAPTTSTDQSTEQEVEDDPELTAEQLKKLKAEAIAARARAAALTQGQ